MPCARSRQLDQQHVQCRRPDMGLHHRGRRARGLCPCEPTSRKDRRTTCCCWKPERTTRLARNRRRLWISSPQRRTPIRLSSGREFPPPLGPRSDNAPDTRPRRRYTAGKVIGGSSSVNGMAANRGLPSDYDHWAALGAEGWDWKGVLPFFRKLESDRDFSGPLHGQDGPIKLQRYAADLWPKFTTAVMAAVEANGWTNIADQNGVFTDGYFPGGLQPH